MWNDGPVYREDVNLETLGSACFTANTHLGKSGLNCYSQSPHLGSSSSHVSQTKKPHRKWLSLKHEFLHFNTFASHLRESIISGCVLTTVFSTTGCVNDRKKQLRQLLKPFPSKKRIWHTTQKDFPIEINKPTYHHSFHQNFINMYFLTTSLRWWGHTHTMTSLDDSVQSIFISMPYKQLHSTLRKYAPLSVCVWMFTTTLLPDLWLRYFTLILNK